MTPWARPKASPAMNFLLITLVAPAVLLSACVPLRVEFVHPALKKEGLKGKTVAVGEVVSAHSENDPTPWDSAVIIRSCEERLRQKRPRTTIINSSALERSVGELKNRLSSAAVSGLNLHCNENIGFWFKIIFFL
jgi:hypothetical protein